MWKILLNICVDLPNLNLKLSYTCISSNYRAEISYTRIPCLRHAANSFVLCLHIFEYSTPVSWVVQSIQRRTLFSTLVPYELARRVTNSSEIGRKCISTRMNTHGVSNWWICHAPVADWQVVGWKRISASTDAHSLGNWRIRHAPVTYTSKLTSKSISTCLYTHLIRKSHTTNTHVAYLSEITGKRVAASMATHIVVNRWVTHAFSAGTAEIRRKCVSASMSASSGGMRRSVYSSESTQHNK